MSDPDTSIEIEDIGEGPSTASTNVDVTMARRTYSQKKALKRSETLVVPGPASKEVSDNLALEAPPVQRIKSVKSHSSVSQSSTEDQMQYATFVQAEQSKKIETLEASQKSLQSQLVAKDKMIAQLKKVEASNATMAMQVIALEKQIQSLKAELTLSKEEIQGYKLEREDFISARSVLVLEDTNKSILIQKLQDDLEKANHGLKQVVSQMVSGKEEAGPSSTALQQQLTSLQKENESLRQENQQLREQNEQQEHSLSQLLLATPQEAPATQSARIANASGNTNRGINFPERSSSAIGLIDLIPEDGASLELQMLRQRALTKRDSEIERLRKENEDLVQQLVATLESLNRL